MLAPSRRLRLRSSGRAVGGPLTRECDGCALGGTPPAATGPANAGFKVTLRAGRTSWARYGFPSAARWRSLLRGQIFGLNRSDRADWREYGIHGDLAAMGRSVRSGAGDVVPRHAVVGERVRGLRVARVILPIALQDPIILRAPSWLVTGDGASSTRVATTGILRARFAVAGAGFHPVQASRSVGRPIVRSDAARGVAPICGTRRGSWEVDARRGHQSVGQRQDLRVVRDRFSYRWLRTAYVVATSLRVPRKSIPD